ENLVLAYMWVSLADAAGQTKAREIRVLLAEKMSSEQIGEARLLARAWTLSTPMRFTQTPVRVEVDGKLLTCSVSPVQAGGRTLVPLRDIFEALGAAVAWDASSKGITANRDGTEVRLTVGGRSATVDGRKVALDAPARVVRGV